MLAKPQACPFAILQWACSDLQHGAKTMTNIKPISPVADDDNDGVAHGLMKEIRRDDHIASDRGVVNIGVIDHDDFYNAKLYLLLDDCDVYRVSVELIGDALDMAAGR